DLERALVASGQLSDATEVLRKLTHADPGRADTYLQRMAEYAFSLSRDEEGLGVAREAVDRIPRDAEVYRRLGELYRARGNPGKAVEAFKRAIELDERLYATRLDVAELETVRGEASHADELCQWVMQRAPDDALVARARRLRIKARLAQGTTEELERELLELSALHADRPVFRRLIIEMYTA